MMASLLTHICATRPQWVNQRCYVCIEIILFATCGWKINPRIKFLRNDTITPILKNYIISFLEVNRVQKYAPNSYLNSYCPMIGIENISQCFILSWASVVPVVLAHTYHDDNTSIICQIPNNIYVYIYGNNRFGQQVMAYQVGGSRRSTYATKTRCATWFSIAVRRSTYKANGIPHVTKLC